MGKVGRGELSYKQAQRRYGIQGRSTVLSWCRRYASHFVTFQAAGPTSPGTAPAVEQTPEQRIKQLETALREQKKQYEKQLKDSAGPESVVAHDAASGGGGPRHRPAKKVFSPAVSRLAGEKS